MHLNLRKLEIKAGFTLYDLSGLQCTRIDKIAFTVRHKNLACTYVYLQVGGTVKGCVCICMVFSFVKSLIACKLIKIKHFTRMIITR